MKLAFSTLGSPAYDLQQVIDLAVSAGYTGIELRALEGTTDLRSLRDFAPERVPISLRRIVDAGLQVACVDTSVRIGAESAERAAQVELAKAHVALATQLESPLIRVFAGPPEGHPDPESTYGIVAEGLNALLDAARGSGVAVAVETHGTLSASRALLDVFSHGVGDDIAIVWDVMHALRSGESLTQTFENVRPYVRLVQLRDSAALRPGEHDYVHTGTGAMPLRDVVRLLDESGYDDFVSFEWEKYWMPELDGPEIVIPQFAAYMSQLL